MYPESRTNVNEMTQMPPSSDPPSSDVAEKPLATIMPKTSALLQSLAATLRQGMGLPGMMRDSRLDEIASLQSRILFDAPNAKRETIEKSPLVLQQKQKIHATLKKTFI